MKAPAVNVPFVPRVTMLVDGCLQGSPTMPPRGPDCIHVLFLVLEERSSELPEDQALNNGFTR